MDIQAPEQPVYTLHKSRARAIIPKILSFMVLGIVFYVGILLNLAILSLDASQETIVNIVSLTILLILIFMGIYLTIHSANAPYRFYRNRLSFKKEEIFYNNIVNIMVKKNLMDKVFKTYTLNLGGDFHVKHIPNNIDMQSYIKQLIDFVKKNPNIQ